MLDKTYSCTNYNTLSNLCLKLDNKNITITFALLIKTELLNELEKWE